MSFAPPVKLGDPRLTGDLSTVTSRVDSFIKEVNSYSSAQVSAGRSLLSSYLPQLDKIISNPQLSKFHTRAKSFKSEIQILLR